MKKWENLLKNMQKIYKKINENEDKDWWKILKNLLKIMKKNIKIIYKKIVK